MKLIKKKIKSEFVEWTFYFKTDAHSSALLLNSFPLNGDIGGYIAPGTDTVPLGSISNTYKNRCLGINLYDIPG